MKGDNLNQPNPEVSTYTDPNSQWIIPMLLSSPNPSRLTKNIIKKNRRSTTSGQYEQFHRRKNTIFRQRKPARNQI
ncbi:hypothetical protein F8M41_004177 [Gigaspora margarita]|uniref:Uncharacterized protein n=1 Tax=Gigaspora margarita TaxID=4874 RepID=A0A8H3XD28_GIGMA|nr:hypothetical protein F8M41_004177 [Gigaspora margarita]